MLKDYNVKNNVTDPKMKWLYRFLFAVICLFLIYMVVKVPLSTYIEDDYVKPLLITGSYQNDIEGDWIPFDDYDQIYTRGSQLVIKGHVNEDIPYGKDIMLYLYRLDVRILINGTEVYHSGQTDITRWGSLISPGLSDKDEITIVMDQISHKAYEGSYKIVLDNLCYGTKYQLQHQQVRKNIVTMSVATLIMVMGIGLLVTMVALMFLKVPAMEGYLVCGLMMIIGSLCSFIDYKYITLIFEHAFIVNIVDYMCQMTMCLLMMIYMRVFIRTKLYLKLTNYIITIWSCMILLYCYLRAFTDVKETQISGFFVSIVLILFGLELRFLLKDYFSYKEYRTKQVLISGLILTGCIIVEIIHFYLVNIYWTFVLEAGLTVFSLVQLKVIISYSKDSIKQAARTRDLEAQLVQSQIAVMLSQIKPHFLYNALGTIRALCLKDVKVARSAIEHFSRYLRANMDSLGKNYNIPFSDELVHVENYLYIEKLRFGDDLNIEYDIQTKDFTCPTLTLQMIVENAVKHGVCKKKGQGTVSIQTSEEMNFYRICVKDDGAGFDINAYMDDQKSHVGIENTRMRIKTMCNGSLTVESEIGVGTRVSILIPKGGNNESDRS